MTVLDPARRKVYELELNRALWRTALAPYSRRRLQESLLDLYLQEAAPLYDYLILPKQFLAKLIETIGDIYADEFPADLPDTDQQRHLLKLVDPTETYKTFLRTFLKSLVECTKGFPAHARTALNVRSSPLFSVTRALLAADDFAPDFAEIPNALNAPIAEACEQLAKHGIFPHRNLFLPPCWDEFDEPEPIFYPDYFTESEPVDDKWDKADWRDRKRRHEAGERTRKQDFQQLDLSLWKVRKERHAKQHKQVRQDTKAWEISFFYSPYFPHRHKISNQSVDIPFDIPEDRWFEACWIVAASGAGKTNLLRHLILNRLEQDATIIILDSKGDLFSSFHRLAAIKDRLIILETTPDYPLAINPFATGHPSEFLDYLFGVFNTGLTAHQSIPFTQIINLLEKVPKPTMETFWDIVVDGAKAYQKEITQLPPRDQRFFEKEFNGPRYAERRAEIQARLRIILNNKWLGPILSSKDTRINMADLLDSGKVICINNSYTLLSPFGSEFLGRLFLALIWYAGRQRKGKKPVYVFLDEAHYVIANDRHIDDMITQLRSKRISLTFAHQFLKQIDDEKVRASLNTCAIKLFNTTGDPMASAYFPNTPSDVLATIDQGHFAAFVKFKTKTAELLPVPHHKLNDDTQTFADTLQYPLIGDYEYHTLMLTMRARYAKRDIPTDELYEENYINPNVADKGGFYSAKVRVNVHGTEWKTLKVSIPANMREGYRIRFPNYGTFRTDGTRGSVIHILYRRTSDAPQTGPAELNTSKHKKQSREEW